MKCIHCGKENPDNFVWCGYCGKIQKRICPNCSHANNPELSVCEKCKKSLIIENTAKPPKKVYYDKTGLYRKNCMVAEGDGITVFANGNGMFMADGEGNLFHRMEYPIAVALGEDCIYGIFNDYETNNMSVKIYDRKFIPKDEKVICKGDLTGNCLYGTDGQNYCQLTYNKGLHYIESLTFTSVNLETFEKKEYHFDKIANGLSTMVKIEDKILVYDGKMYFKATYSGGSSEEDSKGFYAFSFDIGGVQLVPFALHYGMPEFINFERGIAWVLANQKAMTEFFLSTTESGNPPLIPIKIKDGSSYLNMCNPWYTDPDSLYYFDGKRAFCSPRPHILYGVNTSGNYSEDWISDSHGNGNMLYIHNNKIISELYADSKYYELPAKFTPPSDEEKVLLNVTIL